MTISTVLTRARRSQAALALDPLPASNVQSDPPEIAEFDKHNYWLVFHVAETGSRPPQAPGGLGLEAVPA
jgi:hypothetical protein